MSATLIVQTANAKKKKKTSDRANEVVSNNTENYRRSNNVVLTSDWAKEVGSNYTPTQTHKKPSTTIEVAMQFLRLTGRKKL